MALHLAERARQRWQSKGWQSKANATGTELFVEVADFGRPNPDGETQAMFLHETGKPDHHGDPRTLMHPRAEASLLINVSKLFQRIETRSAKAERPAIASRARRPTKAA
jgi:hypothetical protein